MAPTAPASALHRHQSSLEGILDFSSQPPLDPAHRASAKRRFDQIINHFESEGIRPGRDKYDRVKLAEALKRFGLQRRGQGEACDQDGQLLAGQRFEPLEVAHILPHSLTQLDSHGELNASKEAALAILNMFDDGAAHLIEGIEIDRPGNALTLTQPLHTYFGDFNIFFKPEGTVPHRYHIETFLPQGFTDDVPVTRTLFLTEERNIDPPSSRLLAIHCAIAHILHLSAAGDYIDDILRDADEYGIRHDGSTELDRLVGLHLNNWAGSQAHGNAIV
ncbi:hypothetical protein BHE90_012487 [Fusarium euwallaceae]|uniref:HNH nuclease domain-containing protein n=1 Tax=Fusarium euwallaceae TaxID=1147111 RepID=A0A430LBG9_9HYPO|nr:hypothetical protein BHE90_012487 [Fusarium euwallaceae]